jgi:hypothetical protein
VQGSDFGLGLDTTPPSNPLGVTGVSGAAASSFGANETHKITFPALTVGQGLKMLVYYREKTEGTEITKVVDKSILQ